MKFSISSNGFKLLSRPAITEGFRALFYSTKIPTSSKYQKNALYERISPLGDPLVSIVPVLNQWITEGKTVQQGQLRGLVRQLKRYRRFTHALEVSRWMSDRRFFILSPGDIAVRLQLILKVDGIEQVEKYFCSIPKQHRVLEVYHSLQYCYACEKCVEKAETLMQQMKELGFVTSARSFNALLNLYFQVREFEKVDALIDEMKGMGISPDVFTFRTQLSTCAATCNIDGMEKVVMDFDSSAIVDWSFYVIAANGYIKAGLIDKALEMLQKVEKVIKEKDRRFAYDFLLTVYASAGRKDELYRVWNLCKSLGKVYNASFSRMIASVLKFDDIAAAEKILEEWEAGDPSYDFRIPTLLVAAYCKRGLLEKAEMLINKAIEKGEKPSSNALDILARGYIEADQTPKALETMKSALLASRPGWKPSRDTLSNCLVYLKQQGDAAKAENFVKLLGAPGHMTIDDSDRLLDYICFCNKESEPGDVVETDRNGVADDEPNAYEVDETEQNGAANDEEPHVNQAI